MLILNENQQKLTHDEEKIVAARSSKKFHKKVCPFAKNIKANNALTFNTKDQALQFGLKPCTCIA